MAAGQRHLLADPLDQRVAHEEDPPADPHERDPPVAHELVHRRPREADELGRLGDGVIVLLHDSPLYAERDTAAATAEALAALGQRALEAAVALSALGDAVD